MAWNVGAYDAGEWSGVITARCAATFRFHNGEGHGIRLFKVHFKRLISRDDNFNRHASFVEKISGHHEGGPVSPGFFGLVAPAGMPIVGDENKSAVFSKKMDVRDQDFSTLHN